MDIQAVDTQFQQLQTQAQSTGQEVASLAAKLQAAAAAGDPNAREWLLDLKGVALAIQAEQNQVGALLQSVHMAVSSAPAQPSGVGELLGGLMNSSFARSVENGLGFGLGSDIINKIFR